MTDIFFSYSREDKDRVAFIAAALSAEGYDLWWDQDIPPGETYRNYTSKKLREAKCVLVVWSETSVRSRWVIGEAEEGLERDTLVPVLIDDVVREVPIDFRSVQAANLIKWRGDRNDPEWKRVAARVKHHVAQPAKEPQRYRKPRRSGGGRAVFGLAVFFAIIVVGVGFLYWSAERIQTKQKEFQRAQEEQELAEALERVSDIDIELIQRALNALGYRAGEVTNEMGPATRNAIRRFQTNYVAGDSSLTKEDRQAAVTGVLTPRQTVALFKKAAESGHPMSQYVYGVMYIRGMGVLQNGRRGVDWLKRAADADLAIAHYALGVLYRDGVPGRDEVAPDAELARIHFAAATALGYEPAGDALRRLDFESVREDTADSAASDGETGAEKSASEPETSAPATGPAIGARFRDCTGCPEMVAVPAGSFRMGDLNGGGDGDEKPVHTVMFARPFAVGVFEVTFDEWDACVTAGGCSGYRPADGGWGRGRRPVINVSWEDAQGYVAWLSGKTGKNYRLLSEAEWEYVARAGSTTKYHFGDSESSLCRYANGADLSTDYDRRNTSCSDGYGKQTAPAGSFQRNAFGLYDMYGNVWEWVGDCWNDGYSGAPSSGRAWEGGDCTRRVIRGGSWNVEPRNLRSAYRNASTSTGRVNSDGFRLSRTLD